MRIQWPSGQLDLSFSWSSELNAREADSEPGDHNCIWKAHLGCLGWRMDGLFCAEEHAAAFGERQRIVVPHSQADC